MWKSTSFFAVSYLFSAELNHRHSKTRHSTYNICFWIPFGNDEEERIIKKKRTLESLESGVRYMKPVRRLVCEQACYTKIKPAQSNQKENLV